MARQTVFFDIDPGGLLAALNETDSFLEAFNNGQVLGELNQAVYNSLVRKFGEYVDDRARMSAQGDPRGLGDFHHLYETGETGSESARLFEFNIPMEARKRGSAELFGRFEFKDSTSHGWSMGVRPDKDSGVYRTNIKPFARKATVFEMGEPIHLKAGTRFYLRHEKNHTLPAGSIPVVGENKVLDTSQFDTYHRLHEEMGAYLASGMSGAVVNDRMNIVERVVIPDVMKKLEKKIRQHNNSHRFRGGSREGRDLNYRVFDRRKTSPTNPDGLTYINNEYATLLARRLEALGGGSLEVKT